MPESGRKYVFVIAAYLITKSVLNLLLGGIGVASAATLALEIGLAALLLFRVKNARWIVGVLCIALAVYYLPGNLRGLPGTWLYLTEGILDIGAAVMLFVQPDVKAYLDEVRS